MSSTTLRVSLIGAAIAFGLQIVGIIPCVGPVISCLGLLALAVGVGIMVVRVSAEPFATSGAAAGAGAIAGAIAGAVSSVVSTVISLIQVSLGIGMADISNWYRYLPPEAIRELHRYGIDPSSLSAPRTLGVAALAGGCFGLIFSIIIFAAIAAVAAMVYQSSQQGKQGSSDEEA